MSNIRYTIDNFWIMPQNRQHHRKAKYPNKVAKPKSLAFVRIFLFRSAGSRNAYFPTAPCFKFSLSYTFAILLNVSPVILYVVQSDIGSAPRDR